MMKMVAIVMVMNAAVTGPGIARTTASAFGRNAIPMNTTPSATPMRREASPVISTMDVPVGRNPSGIVPETADTRFPAASAATAPWTARKSTALGSGPGHPLDRDRPADGLDGADEADEEERRQQGPEGGPPKSRSRPGHSAAGKPIHEASAMRPEVVETERAGDERPRDDTG